MRNHKVTTCTLAGLALTAVLGVTACSSQGTSSATSSETAPASETALSSSEMPAEPTTSAAEPAANPVGPACAAYAEQVPSGPGSVAGMALDPVTVAASNNPMLTTLTAALSGQLNPEVNLVETLDTGEFTVFAPTDEAFAKIDPATLESLKTDSATLTDILTYHVVAGQAGPDQVVGEHVTVQGEPVTVTGAGDTLMVNDAAVVCGGVATANATVYMIDTVLMPPA